MKHARVLRGVAGVAGFLAAAEVVGATGLIDDRFLPRMSAILRGAAELLVDQEFLVDARASLAAWGLGLLLTVAVAVPAGLALGALPPVERAVRPLIEFLRPIPSVAIIPLAILIFADNLHLRVAVVVYAASWPIVINTIYALQDVDPLAKETLRSFGFGPVSVLLRVALPSAAPFIATGIRVAAGTAVILVVSAELLAGGSEGIGIYITEAASGNRMDLMLGAALWAGLFGVLSNTALVAVERRLFRWHAVRTGAAR
ncbi:ABC transporter permease [Microbispora sp. SCL1-1]|uniref:ABC transporter permease n=1 Tax=unclassified Microbispora TaxID=2614687 RepID=UPI0011587B6F|nr:MULTISPECIES: ABC transporter permease [unclassified Microbispora]NJP30185.1 ABC transporter permease [Microbispora sp. CL1-1]TQS02580.1 ABC transporter permease [Microbispora sp. SCL1-1]